MNNDATMSAPAVAGGKLRLSEIISALCAHEVEMDCTAVLLAVDKKGVQEVFDFDRVSVQDVTDVKLLMLHLGLPELASQVLHDVPEATAAVAAAGARGRERARMLAEIMRAADDGDEDDKEADSKVGKEGK